MSGSQRIYSQTRQSNFATRFPDYTDVSELGRGGMGVVYKARHKINGHFVVIKTMLKGGDDRQVQRFQREAEALADISHHNIVSIKTVGQSAGEHYFAMEYIEGQNLSELVTQHLREFDRVPDLQISIRIVGGIAKGLKNCHEKGIVHRDVKPENIVIGPDRPVLVDFGLAKQMGSQFDTTVENLTKTGQMLGTPGFMPPEQLEFNGEYGQIGPASDVWSLGATLYYCLCGQQPFGTLPFSAWCMAVVDRNPPSVKTLNPVVPDWLAEICSDCLERNPKERPSLEEFCERLEKGESVPARRSRRPIYLGAFILVIAMVVTGFFVARQDQERPKMALKSAGTLISKSISNPITIVGRVIDKAPAWVAVNSKRYQVRKSGAFKIRIDKLKEGAHTLTLIAEDASGNFSAPTAIEAIVDHTPPSFKVESVAVENERLSLSVQVSEDLESFTIDGVEVPVGSRQLRHSIPIAKVTGDLRLELIDKVGHKTSSHAPSLYIVGPKSRARSLAKALQNTPAGGSIVLLTGKYRCHSEIDKDVSILGLTGQGSVLMRTEQPIRINNGSKVNLKNLSLEGTRKTAPAALYIHGGATVTIDRCRISSVGMRVIQLQGSKRLAAMPSVRILRSTIQRSIGPTLVAERGKIRAKDSIFKDPGPSLQPNGDWSRASVELREGSTGRFENCQLSDSLDRGVLIDQSTGEFFNCKIERSMCEGALIRQRSRAIFRGCDFIHNSYSGVLILKKSSVDFIDCKFIKNGHKGSSPDRTNGLRIFGDSSVQLIRTVVKDHVNKGVIADRSKLNIYQCQIEKNEQGNVSQVDSVITHKAPGE